MEASIENAKVDVIISDSKSNTVHLLGEIVSWDVVGGFVTINDPVGKVTHILNFRFIVDIRVLSAPSALPAPSPSQENKAVPDDLGIVGKTVSILLSIREESNKPYWIVGLVKSNEPVSGLLWVIDNNGKEHFVNQRYIADIQRPMENIGLTPPISPSEQV
jgi:hypothetical protein